MPPLDKPRALASWSKPLDQIRHRRIAWDRAPPLDAYIKTVGAPLGVLLHTSRADQPAAMHVHLPSGENVLGWEVAGA